jgi:predicted site-specific integrase-resolvase
MTGTFLNAKELAQRWKLSPSTLERWRWLGVGPNFVKIGGRIRYRLDEVEAYEATHGEGAVRQLAAHNVAAEPEGVA